MYTNHLHFTNNIHWPCKVTINYETGKVEINLRKIVSKLWDNYGVLKQTCNSVSIASDTKVKYIVVNKVEVNHNTCLLALQRSDGVKQTIPLGKHVRVYGEWNGKSIIINSNTQCSVKVSNMVILNSSVCNTLPLPQ